MEVRKWPGHCLFKAYQHVKRLSVTFIWNRKHLGAGSRDSQPGVTHTNLATYVARPQFSQPGVTHTNLATYVAQASIQQLAEDDTEICPPASAPVFQGSEAPVPAG